MILKKLFYFMYIAFFIPAISTFAHGTKYEILQDKAIGIKAMYDIGDPIVYAKVLIFAPEETKVSYTTTTDSSGIFYFTPDKAGTWILQVRDKSGHGMRINLEINESMQLASDKKCMHSGMTFLQKVIIAICVVWGCVGTALYFKRKEKA